MEQNKALEIVALEAIRRMQMGRLLLRDDLRRAKEQLEIGDALLTVLLHGEALG